LPNAIGNFEQSMMRIQGGMSPQLRIDRLWALSTIAKEFVIVTVANEPTLFVSYQTILAFGDKPLAHTLEIQRVKIAICRVAIMRTGMDSRLLWLFNCHI
jgi:hypothetical protein